MNNGKKLCKLLRQIRQDIAIRYQLNYMNVRKLPISKFYV